MLARTAASIEPCAATASALPERPYVDVVAPVGARSGCGSTWTDAPLSASAERCGRALTVCCGPLRKVGIRRALWPVPLGCDDVATKSLRRQDKKTNRATVSAAPSDDCVGIDLTAHLYEPYSTRPRDLPPPHTTPNSDVQYAIATRHATSP